MPVATPSSGAAQMAPAGSSLDLGFLGQKALAFAPKVLLAFAALVVGFLLARFVAGLTRRIALRMNLGGLLQKVGFASFLARARPGHGIEDLLAAMVRRVVQFGALLFALDALGISAAMDLLAVVFGFLPRMVTAVVALVAGAWMAQLAGSLASAAAAGAGVNFHAQLGQTIRALLLMVTGILALDQLGVKTELLQGTFLNLLSLGAAGMALAFGLGARDILADLLAGYYARQRFLPGETLTVDGREGVLTQIGPLNSELEQTPDRVRVVIPNRTLMGTTVLVRD
ncbi:MAG TPA: mechanosensitive ion channel [Anaerolineae bacterium]|nr:mechanosensitive ion channel [Anaerolineae bacterium]